MPCAKPAPRRALGRDTRVLSGRRTEARARSDQARCRIIPIHHVKQRSLLRSRGALLRPGFVFLCSIHPHEGRAERRKAQVFCCRARDARRSTPGEARRASSGTRSPLGAPPWRFWAGGRASFSGIASGSVQRAPRSQVVVPGGRGPEPPGADGYEPRPQDATPRSAFGASPETAPQMSEDMRNVAYARYVVNILFEEKPQNRALRRADIELAQVARRHPRVVDEARGASIRSAQPTIPFHRSKP